MEFIDLKTQQQRIRKKIDRNIHHVMDHGRYIMGPEVAELEGRLAAYIQVKHAIGVASGTDALLIAMMALGIGHGDEVITTPFSFIATAETIALLGAKPVFADIEPATYNIDPSKIKALITAKTKAIIPVSVFGQCADLDTINAIAETDQLAVIEDACQSFGASYKGKKSCSLTHISCTSFFPSKPLGCYGDGGACFTNDDGLARIMRELRIHGQNKRYHHTRIGINGRLDTIQAAILLAKLDIFSEELEARQIIAKRYEQKLQSIGFHPPFIEKCNSSTFAQYTIQVNNREHVQKQLHDNNIPTAIHYPIPLHQQPAIRSLASYEHSEYAAQHVLSLPMHPYLSEQQQNTIVQTLQDACKK